MAARILPALTLCSVLIAGAVNAEPERRVTSAEDQKQNRKRESLSPQSRTPRKDPQREPAQERPEENAPKSEKQPETPNRQYSLSAKMTLGDGKTVRGQIRLAAPERMQLTHESGGVRYERQISPDEISSLEILRWKHKFIRENKSGLVYEFIPDEVRIRLKDGGEIKRTGPIFPFLRQFVLENKNGKVTLFTFWVDLKRPDGKWHTGLTGPESGVRVICHPEAVRRIDFD